LIKIGLDSAYNSADKAKTGSKRLFGMDRAIRSLPTPSPWVWPLDGVPLNKDPCSQPIGFQFLPRRWVVERIFAWFHQSRRLSKDCERLIASVKP